MKREDIRLGEYCIVVSNKSDHGFDIGSVIRISQITPEGCIEGISAQGMWFVKPEELKPIENTTKITPHKWHMIVDTLLDEIEDMSKGMGELLYSEIVSLYGYPYKWESKR